MQLSIHHRFETEAVSGKQHCFSWYQWNPEDKTRQFVCRAMYQSGEDNLLLHNGGKAKRGHVLRLQFDEQGSTAPAQSLALQVTGDGWKEKDYVSFAHHLLHECKANNTGKPLSLEQKAAVFSQLASLYALMATQYGTVFQVGIPPFDDMNVEKVKKTLNGMVTDPTLHAASDWFKGIAAQLIQGREPQLPPLVFPAPSNNPLVAYGWQHGIEASDGAKFHSFTFLRAYQPPDYRDGDELSPDPDNERFPFRKIADVWYQSGKHGSRACFIPFNENTRQPALPGKEPWFELCTQLGFNTFSRPLGEDIFAAPDTPVPLVDNMRPLVKAFKEKQIGGWQLLASLTMLASFYRLTATSYGSQYGYDENGQPLAPHYFDDPRSDEKSFAMKCDAMGKGYRRDEMSDYRFETEKGEMLTRAKLITDAASLRDFVSSSGFTQEADSAINMAAELVKGQEPDLQRYSRPREVITVRQPKGKDMVADRGLRRP